MILRTLGWMGLWFGFSLSFALSFVHASDLVQVGIYAEDATPPVGVPLAGYGSMERRLPLDIWDKYKYAHYFKPSIGVHSPIRSKVMVLKNAEKTLAFVSLDVIGLDHRFYLEVKKHAAALGIDDLFMGATHTHSGPGTLSRSWLFQIMAADRYQEEVYEGFRAAVLDSIDQAMARLQPGRLEQFSFHADGIQRNRRHRDGHFDPDAHILLARDLSGQAIGGLVNFAVHPIAFGPKNLYLSSDLAGGIERALKKEFAASADFVFMNSTEGDVSTHADGVDGIELHGHNFAVAAAQAAGSAKPVEPVWTTRAKTITLPKGKLALWACDEKILKKIFGRARLGVGAKALPRTAEIKQLDLGNLRMLTWPGEATTDLGLYSRTIAADEGVVSVWNLGLTNGYMGYLVTPEEFQAGGYEVCVAYHGPQAGAQILQTHQELLNQARR